VLIPAVPIVFGIFVAYQTSEWQAAVGFSIFGGFALLFFELIYGQEFRNRERAFREGQHVDGTVLDKKTTRRSAQSIIEVEYTINGKAIAAWGPVSEKIYRNTQPGYRLAIRVHPSRPNCWVPDGEVGQTAP